MRIYKIKQALVLFALILVYACSSAKQNPLALRYQYANILDICCTPDTLTQCGGCFTDLGSWMGFTPPQKTKWVNGFCGPFSIDSRQLISRSLVTVGFASEKQDAKSQVFRPDSVSYFPGELYLSASSSLGSIEQRLIFVSDSEALLRCQSNTHLSYQFMNDLIATGAKCEINQNSCVFTMPSGEIAAITFSPESKLRLTKRGYVAICGADEGYAVISFVSNSNELEAKLEKARIIIGNPNKCVAENKKRWNDYLSKVLRPEMPEVYNRIAVKSVVTLISNWRSAKGGLLHDGVVPSHAVGYFVGFWAWDSWKHAVALASFAPELAKNQVRAMFDYQQEDGMIVDCIYLTRGENNNRDSKPPLAAWAVDEIYKATNDTAFVKEMYPQLLKYYRWWYANRDHDHNGICEFGSVDGTLEAAAWESGMDNAIRFDHSKMIKNGENAWSIDQESVDLNAYLAVEHRLLKKMAGIIGQPFQEKDYTKDVNNYFFDNQVGFFFDKRLDGTFVREEGSEAYTPIWANIATKEQVAQSLKILTNPTKFSTYIPFPTAAADNPKFIAKGYWRGPIWLDQTYLAISGLRKYGYKELADKYTRQVFDRLQGLQGGGAIHENYGTHTGEVLKAPHFSWSAAHLLMMYQEYGK